MAEPKGPLFEGPIPGMGLTHELGGRPWQKPPQYTTVDEALEYYLPKFSDPDLMDQLLDVMELGIPLTTIADAMQSGSVMEGLHTIDVGILILPFLVEMISYVGDLAGIEYTMGTSKVKIKNPEMIPPTDQEISVAEKRLDEAKENIEIEDVPIEEEEPKGLMARRNKNG